MTQTNISEFPKFLFETINMQNRRFFVVLRMFFSLLIYKQTREKKYQCMTIFEKQEFWPHSQFKIFWVRKTLVHCYNPILTCQAGRYTLLSPYSYKSGRQIYIAITLFLQVRQADIHCYHPILTSQAGSYTLLSPYYY